MVLEPIRLFFSRIPADPLVQFFLDLFARMTAQTDPVMTAVFLLAVMALLLVGMALYVLHAAIRGRKE